MVRKSPRQLRLSAHTRSQWLTRARTGKLKTVRPHKVYRAKKIAATKSTTQRQLRHNKQVKLTTKYLEGVIRGWW